MKIKTKPTARWIETFLLVPVFIIALLGFALLAIGMQIKLGGNPWIGLPGALLPPLVICLSTALLHELMRRQGMQQGQLILPVTTLIFTIGLLMIWRLQGSSGVWQQLTRGYLPGMAVMAALIVRPRWVERIRRWAIPVSLVGLLLLLATAFIGVVDETGARLAIQLGSLPPIQPSEIIKLSLIIFLAWYIDRQGKSAEGRAKPFLSWLRLPPIYYFLPGSLFTVLATLALVKMADFGAVLILAAIFVGMLFVGFDTRIFLTVSAIGLLLVLLVSLVLSTVWQVPTVIRYRFLAFQNPWSNEEIVLDGRSTGITISQGPGYQTQQAINAVVAGGLSGTGLGFGTPQYVPLGQSDFIFAAIIEELGSIIGLAVLIFFTILLIRIARVALLLPAGQVFERLLLIGICIHFFVQVVIMVGGTLDLLPVTGVTIPFLSQGGMALLVNLIEVGLALSLSQRLGVQPV
ncbi:MAG TPA: FtsW/RodA/SpoVE family cell cycle protein [Anaerolineaceae bacterium]|nr:FtsW/RodA/SpoVE family cell cycle protein [Anaerolineaceae bacterium]